MFDPNGGAAAPGPGGCAPAPSLAPGGSPLLLARQKGRAIERKKEVYQTMGERLAAGKVDRWVTRNGARKRGVGLSTREPRRGAAGARKPRSGIQLTGRRPASWGGEATPRAPQGSLSEGKCSESTYRRKWQNGAMAHFAILRVQKLKSAVAVHRSMKHSFRAQDTPNADAELSHLNEHFGAHSVAEGMAAFRSRLPESFRKDAVQAVST